MVSMACSNQLKDYTQLTLQASAPSGGEISEESLKETQSILESRLVGLGIASAEVKTEAPNQLIVRLPQGVNVKAAESLLTNTGQLYLRNQKPDTEADLASGIEDLQRLLVEQDTLSQQGKEAEAEALQGQIDEAREAIAALFESSQLTGERLYDAEAQPTSLSDVWEVTVQFDEQGADMFAEQTKLMAGTGRTIGLFLDNVLLSTPAVDVAYAKTGIVDGTAVISGNFTKTAARALAVQLKSGALPVKLKTVEVVSSKSKS